MEIDDETEDPDLKRAARRILAKHYAAPEADHDSPADDARQTVGTLARKLAVLRGAIHAPHCAPSETLPILWASDGGEESDGSAFRAVIERLQAWAALSPGAGLAFLNADDAAALLASRLFHLAQSPLEVLEQLRAHEAQVCAWCEARAAFKRDTRDAARSILEEARAGKFALFGARYDDLDLAALDAIPLGYLMAEVVLEPFGDLMRPARTDEKTQPWLPDVDAHYRACFVRRDDAEALLERSEISAGVVSSIADAPTPVSEALESPADAPLSEAEQDRQTVFNAALVFAPDWPRWFAANKATCKAEFPRLGRKDDNSRTPRSIYIHLIWETLPAPVCRRLGDMDGLQTVLASDERFAYHRKPRRSSSAPAAGDQAETGKDRVN